MSFKGFITYLTVYHLPAPSTRNIWNFEGAYISGNVLNGGDEFPLERTQEEWLKSYADFLEVRKVYNR